MDQSLAETICTVHLLATVSCGKGSIRASIALRMASGNVSQPRITRRRSASLSADSSHSGRSVCSASAARHSGQITRPLGRTPVAAKSASGSNPVGSQYAAHGSKFATSRRSLACNVLRCGTSSRLWCSGRHRRCGCELRANFQNSF